MVKTLLQRAIEFAAQAHENGVRKGTGIPYIVHPIEVMKIVCKITPDEEVRAAAVLHDTVEDTPTTIEDIERIFGKRVAELVAAESEDKRPDKPETATWHIRKAETFGHLKDASYEVKLICLGDKLANIRDIHRDYAELGDVLWARFNAPESIPLQDKKEYVGKRAVIGWYYRGIADRLKEELADTAAWKEYDKLIKETFEN